MKTKDKNHGKKHPITILKAIAIIMLLWALADNPYWYYQLLRWVVCGVSAYSAYIYYQEKNTTWMWIFIIVAVLFNPIASFYFGREIWEALDIIAAAIIFVSLLKTKHIK